MKRPLLSTISWVTLSASSVFAADLPSIKSEPVAAPVPMWAGFYAGLNLGGGFGTSPNAGTIDWETYDWASSALGLPYGFTDGYRQVNAIINQGGVIGGGQLGYNYQFSSNVLLGLETDFQGTSISGSGAAYGLGGAVDKEATTHLQYGAVNTTAGIGWMGTARARIGYLVSPTMLLFGTGGLAYGYTTANVFTFGFHWHPGNEVAHPPNQVVPTWQTSNQLNAGWTAGGGAEWMFLQNWSAKIEAIYYNLGSNTVVGQYSPLLNPSAPYGIAIINAAATRVTYEGIIARAGVNYHFNLANVAPVVAKF